MVGLPEGNPAWYWRLQCEGNAQEHMGAEARIQTLPRRGKDWWITSHSLEADSQLFFSFQKRFSHIPPQKVLDLRLPIFILFCKKNKAGLENILRFVNRYTPSLHGVVVFHISSIPFRGGGCLFEFVVLFRDTELWLPCLNFLIKA